MDAGVQAGLLAEGKIGGASATLSVIDNANLTRELERFAVNYEVGQTIEFVRGSIRRGSHPEWARSPASTAPTAKSRLCGLMAAAIVYSGPARDQPR